MECRACDAGMSHGMCVKKNVVYAMDCTVCGEEYVGETERPVRVRMTEHYRDAKTRAVRAPWGAHYVEEHADVDTSSPKFLPFKNARIVTTEVSQSE